MRFDDLPVLADIRAALSYHSQRSRVIATNVANADTPGFRPRDMAEADLGRALEARRGTARASGLSVTHAGHLLDRSGGETEFALTERDDSETTVDGNAVVLEEQMARASETRMAFDTAIALYQKSLSFIRMAVRPPGR